MIENHRAEVESGRRFEFGANWTRFLNVLSEARIVQAEKSLCSMLSVDNLEGKNFLDAGSGSGLFSLAARRLGANVHSFDYDPKSVACTRELKNRYFQGDEKWHVDEASILDPNYLSGIGHYDVVYSWGVLHHTGSMWQALNNVAELVNANGTLFIALYNDQGWISQYWAIVKKMYARNFFLKSAVLIAHLPYLFGLRLLARAVTGRLDIERGMSLWYDMIDWVGGHPFEVAKPEEIFDFCLNRNFQLSKLASCGGRHGCNEFVFTKS